MRHRFHELLSAIRPSNNPAGAYTAWKNNGQIIRRFKTDHPAVQKAYVHKLVCEITSSLNLWEVSRTETPDGQFLFQYQTF